MPDGGILELRQIDKAFADKAGVAHRALADVTLSVEEHEIVALVGTSGCGKSTLLRLVAGLETPSGGAVRLAGRAIEGPRPEVGVVFQEPRLMPWLTVAENVRFALADLPREEQERRTAEALEKVKLQGFERALPRQLSGGMAQRVAIARALARRPRILLLDEPFGALDAFTRRAMQAHLLELWAAERFTMLFVTHDLAEAVTLADRVVVLRGNPGRVVEIVPVDLPRPRRGDQPEAVALERHVEGLLDLG
ncbi:MAG: ABC transporter ATP-binding protein [Tistlia sp.]|uniref:ABC transporter ATP-binding protein n=1 Tax=Tistlia sp. TaxID=3057121 RepID=UPI0034A0E74F